MMLGLPTLSMSRHPHEADRTKGTSKPTLYHDIDKETSSKDRTS